LYLIYYIIAVCSLLESGEHRFFAYGKNTNLLAAEHFRLLVRRRGTACYRSLRRRYLWQPSALDSRRFIIIIIIIQCICSAFITYTEHRRIPRV